MAAAFPEITEAIVRLPRGLVLDGELVVPDAAGRSDFAALRRRALLQRPQRIAEAAQRTPAVLVVFDLLHDSEDVRHLPLAARRGRLQKRVAGRSGIQVVQAIPTHGEALFAAIVEQDHEGVVAKRLDAPYRAGRQSAWVKIKNKNYSRREALEWRP
jgi:ATP-dependent DNA ligase